MAAKREDMNIVIVGHVDHGKSTIIGRLLADTKSLPEGKLERIKETCRRNSKPFEYAFLLDALKEEQSQGITIDVARCFFKTNKRSYIIIDAPGHVEFLKNMVTGASRAEAALLVIDAEEGVQENSRRHGYLLSMLGINQVVVLVNKMDLVDYSEIKYRNIVKEYTDFLQEIGINPSSFIPVSGMQGDNIANKSEKTSWYKGETVLTALDEFETEKLPENKPFRMPVQGIYKFTRGGDNRRIIAGTIECGKLTVGDKVVFYPSGKKSTVKSIEAFNRETSSSIGVGYATGFTMEEQIYVKRGEIAALADQPEPKVTSRIRTNLFWLGRQPMEKKKDYLLKLGTTKVVVQIEEVLRVIDASNLKQTTEKEKIERHDVAECILKLDKAIAFDLADEISQTSRFVIVDNYEISGGGIIQESLEDKQSWLREKVYRRNDKWQKSFVGNDERSERYNQKATLILLTGEKGVGKKTLGKVLEKSLFNAGKFVYFLTIGNVLYGIDADIKGDINNKEEHLRRLAEVANLMLDAGMLLVVTARELSQEDLELIKTTINPDQIETVWIGDNITTNLSYDLHIPSCDSPEEAADEIKDLLQNRGIIFKVH